jgi:hypothetical protein
MLFSLEEENNDEILQYVTNFFITKENTSTKLYTTI